MRYFMEPAVFSKMASKAVTHPVISTNKLPIKQGNETSDKLFRHTTKQFENIFKSMVFCLRVIGIPVGISGIESCFLKWWSISFGLISFFINLSLNLYAVYLDHSTHAEVGSLGITIVNINYAFAFTCTHATLFGIVSLKWKGMFSFLQDIEKLDLFRSEEYRKFRKICVIGGLINLFMVNGLNYGHILKH